MMSFDFPQVSIAEDQLVQAGLPGGGSAPRKISHPLESASCPKHSSQGDGRGTRGRVETQMVRHAVISISFY